jgi:hypothetical protein
LLLFHAVNDGGLRTTVAQAKAAGIASMSAVALHKRLKTSGAWLEWIASGLCRSFREQPRLPSSLRPRVIDGTTIQRPASRTSDWRLHYVMDLASLACDWHELTEATSAEALERAPVQKGDVLIGDRNFLRLRGVESVVAREGHVLLRMRWRHSRMTYTNGRRFQALTSVRRLRVGQIGERSVRLLVPGGEPIPGRVVATRLPAPVGARNEKRVRRLASRKSVQLDPRSVEAAHLVMLFTTLSSEVLEAGDVLELYRYRWQIELAFKRHKQLLRLGRLPHQDQAAARSWILAKLVVALVLETLYRNAKSFSPWGYRIRAVRQEGAISAT